MSALQTVPGSFPVRSPPDPAAGCSLREVGLLLVRGLYDPWPVTWGHGPPGFVQVLLSGRGV
jgi:hypothetical protein